MREALVVVIVCEFEPRSWQALRNTAICDQVGQ